jgi:hypothetical protein
MATLSPIPDKSNLLNGTLISSVWLNWFRDLELYILKFLNKYSSAKAGLATLAAGQVTVTNSAAKTTSNILLTAQETGAFVGHIYIQAKNDGSFVIQSTNNQDTRKVFYMIMEAF